MDAVPLSTFPGPPHLSPRQPFDNNPLQRYTSNQPTRPTLRVARSYGPCLLPASTPGRLGVGKANSYALSWQSPAFCALADDPLFAAILKQPSFCCRELS